MEGFALRPAILILHLCTEGAGVGVYSGGGREAEKYISRFLLKRPPSPE